MLSGTTTALVCTTNKNAVACRGLTRAARPRCKENSRNGGCLAQALTWV